MSNRESWNARYHARKSSAGSAPLDFLVDNINLLPRGKALDIAMGEGRNALYLARQGYDVVGIDYSEVAVQRCQEEARALGVTVKAIVADLDSFILPKAGFDVVLNSYFLQRDLIVEIKKAIRVGGVVVFETYTTEQLQFDPTMNADFLLNPGELLHLFPEFNTLVYREGIIYNEETKRRKAVASLIARKFQRG